MYAQSVQFIPKNDVTEIETVIDQIELTPKDEMEIDENVDAINQVVTSP